MSSRRVYLINFTCVLIASALNVSSVVLISPSMCFSKARLFLVSYACFSRAKAAASAFKLPPVVMAELYTLRLIQTS